LLAGSRSARALAAGTLIARGGLAEAEHVISMAQGIQQVPIRDEVI
jgi:hypothetical protein